MKFKYHRIPEETIRRLPVYLRGLLFSSQMGYRKVSSGELAEFVVVNSSQIRKDLSYFGEFGKRGVGYDIEKLAKEIRKILKLGTVRKAALVGAGNLGSAVLTYPGFKIYNFDITAAFDTDLKKIGKKVRDITIEDVRNIAKLKKRKTDLGIIAVPQANAQKTAGELVKAGVKAILNFSPCDITVPKRIKVVTINIAMDLARLPYYMPAS
jgi:redox-sensing transcriptional repressor